MNRWQTELLHLILILSLRYTFEISGLFDVFFIFFIFLSIYLFTYFWGDVFYFQSAAETAYDVVSPDSPVKRGQNRLAQQPFDLREGVSNAYQVFREVRHIFYTH